MAYVYLLIEFQSSVDHFMAVRVLAYLGLLYQDIIRTGGLTPDRLLPPVLPLVLYNGKPRWTAPEEVADLVAASPAGLDRYRPRLRYLLLDEGRYADGELAPLCNLAAALFRMENSRTPQDVEQVLSALVEWLKSPGQDSLRRTHRMAKTGVLAGVLAWCGFRQSKRIANGTTKNYHSRGRHAPLRCRAASVWVAVGRCQAGR